jgi:hypothetical protein
MLRLVDQPVYIAYMYEAGRKGVEIEIATHTRHHCCLSVACERDPVIAIGEGLMNMDTANTCLSLIAKVGLLIALIVEVNLNIQMMYVQIHYQV